MSDGWGIVVGALVGYVIGMFPSADLVARTARRGAPSTFALPGRGIPGGSNAARVLGRKWGLLVIVMDAAKGALAGLVGLAIGDAAAYAAGTGVIAGHCWPVWNGFRGGKGVAAAGGSFFTVFPPLVPIDGLTTAAVAFLGKSSRLAIKVALVIWVVSAVVWWAADWSLWWGPQPTVGSGDLRTPRGGDDPGPVHGVGQGGRRVPVGSAGPGDPEGGSVANGTWMGRTVTASSDRRTGERTVPPSGWEHEVRDRVVAGDDTALREVYDQFSSFVYGLAARVIGDTRAAEDVSQDVFVAFWERPDVFDPERGSLRTWLGTLTHRRAVDHVRREEARRRRAERAASRAVPEPDVEEMATALLTAERVRAALELLPPDQRRAIQLAYFGGKTYRQVAETLGIPEGTAKSRLRLALRRIADALEAEGDEW